jgi:hypothetical protein
MLLEKNAALMVIFMLRTHTAVGWHNVATGLFSVGGRPDSDESGSDAV